VTEPQKPSATWCYSTPISLVRKLVVHGHPEQAATGFQKLLDALVEDWNQPRALRGHQLPGGDWSDIGQVLERGVQVVGGAPWAEDQATSIPNVQSAGNLSKQRVKTFGLCDEEFGCCRRTNLNAESLDRDDIGAPNWFG
jgi:hypothetical protein